MFFVRCFYLCCVLRVCGYNAAEAVFDDNTLLHCCRSGFVMMIILMRMSFCMLIKHPQAACGIQGHVILNQQRERERE